MYTLGWPYTEGNWLYCDYFIWCVSCTVVILTCFVMCVCFGNICTCIYCVFVLFRLCIFILICFVRTSVRTTATEWQLNCSNSGGGSSSSSSSKYLMDLVSRLRVKPHSVTNNQLCHWFTSSYDYILENNLVRKSFLSRHCLKVSDLGFRSTTLPGIMQYYGYEHCLVHQACLLLARMA